MKTVSTLLWPEDQSEALDVGTAAAVCYFNNPAGNVKKYVADCCEQVVLSRAEQEAADGMDRREIDRLMLSARMYFLQLAREAYREAYAVLKKQDSAKRRAILIFENFLTPLRNAAGVSRHIAFIPADQLYKNHCNQAIRAQYLRQEKFNASK